MIWSGFGLLGVFFGGLGFFTTIGLRNLFGPDHLPFFWAAGGLFAGAPCWIAGSYLRGRLWYIPLKYYGPIYLVLFGALAFNEVRKQTAAIPENGNQVATANVTPAAPAISPAQAEEATDKNAGESGSPAGAPVTGPANNPPPGPGVLSWQLRTETDKITDKTTRKAVSGGVFDDDVSLEAYAACDPIGVEFAFDTFHDRNAAPFAWRDDAIGMRLRIDGGDVHTATAKAEYTNEAKIVFYDPAAAEDQIQGAFHAQGGTNPIVGSFYGAMGGVALKELQAKAAGTLNELANARSIRVELPLATAHAYVVDLNPQDQAVKAIVQSCITALHANLSPQWKAAQEARGRAEQERIAKLQEERLRKEVLLKNLTCLMGRELVVYSKATIRSLDEFDPRRSGTVAVADLPVGTKVVAANELGLGLPSGAKIPNNRCVVSYAGPKGQVQGTVELGVLTDPVIYDAYKGSPQPWPSPTVWCHRGTVANLEGDCRPVNSSSR
jgi:hypothetical protein